MMKKSSLKHSLLSLTLACTTGISSTLVMAQPETVEQKAAYSIGNNFINSIKSQGIELDINSLISGIKDGSSGKVTLSTEEMKNALNAFKAKLVTKEQKKQQAAASENLKLGAAFLAKNKTKEGIVTLASGLQYKIITTGTGSIPKATDKVTTHYRGTLIDGTEFDSSYSRKKPTTFPVSGVIPGWVEALQLMHIGDKWQLFVPADLAYGNRAVGNVIKPGSTLIFEIELIEINKPEEAKG
jgi:FKBP-type peptidyl-prolyl cis-trans isomerase